MDKNDFIRIIRGHQPMIYKICNYYCADPENRKDLQQEIILQLWHSLERFDGRVKLSTWIYRIALNTAITFYRGESKYISSRHPLDEQIISLPDTDPSLQEYEERLSFLHRFIEKQNELEKALLLLYLDGVRQSEIAQIIGISETNVATKLSRIKQRIRKEYEQS